MDSYKEKYERVLEEFETYQNFAETQIQLLSEKNIQLEKNMDALVNIVEISKYINSYLSDENLIPMINDMIIGILGVTYSSVYLKVNGEMVMKASNIQDSSLILMENKYIKRIENGKPFILNCKEPLFQTEDRIDLHSIIGVPIQLRDKFIGYIILEHTLWNFFGYDHIKFISSIANQIAIAIENSFLYKEIQEQLKRDPLLGIYTRKYFIDFVEKKINKSKKDIFAIVMIDLDDFKNINDRFGHQFGDTVLLNTVELIKDNLNPKDMVARYGGEEIVLYIEEAENSKAVYEKIDSIRENIKDNKVDLRQNNYKITATFGISYYPKDGRDVNKLLQVADELLYEGKRSGKNKVLVNI